MNCGTYEITIPVTGGRYETLRADRIVLLMRLDRGWLVGIDQDDYYFLDSVSTIRAPEGKLYGMDKFPLLSELLSTEKSLEAL